MTPDERRHALAFNAVGPAVNEAGCWLPLSARKVVAEAVLAAIADSAAGYCPHCGRGDAGPTADQYDALRKRARQDAAASRESERQLQQQIERQAKEIDRLRDELGALRGDQPKAEFTVRKLVAWVPACPTGRHTAHPGHTCDEADAAADHWAEVCAQADRVFATPASAISAALRGPNWKPRPTA